MLLWLLSVSNNGCPSCACGNGICEKNMRSRSSKRQQQECGSRNVAAELQAMVAAVCEGNGVSPWPPARPVQTASTNSSGKSNPRREAASFYLCCSGSEYQCLPGVVHCLLSLLIPCCFFSPSITFLKHKLSKLPSFIFLE